MRLTLRTLLAYLDDTLEPPQAKEIGEKLNESSLAAGLVSRIREVMRRRRLTAPTLSGPGVGIDPNTVAEYLDNELAPDGVADVEKICLESDMHLAEVAACHQILTVATVEPVEISPQMRERMYALGPSGARMEIPAAGLPGGFGGDLTAGAVHDVLAQAEPASPKPRNGQPVVSVAPKPEVPEYLKSKSNFKRILGYVAAAAVLVAWGVMVVKNSPFQGGTPTADRRGNRAGTGVPAEDGDLPPVGNTEDQEPGDRDVAANSADREEPDAAQRPPVRPRPRTPAPAEDDSATATEVPPRQVVGRDRRPVTRQPDARQPADADGPVPMPPDEAEGPPVAVPQVQLAKYTSTEGILLQYVRRDERWFVLPHGEMVGPGANLAVPEPFQGELEFDGGKGRVTIQGHSLVGIIPPAADGRFGLDLQRGSFVIRSGSSAEDAPGSLKVRIGIAGQIWRLELQAGAVCGVLVKPIEAARISDAPEANAYDGAFYVSEGIAIATDPTGQPYEIKGPDWLELPLPVADANGKLPKKRPLLVVPKWMGPQHLSPIVQSKAIVFEKKFVMNEAVELSVPEIAEDANPLISQMATECLGLIEAYSPLVSILKSQHVEARKVAISELRLWLPRHPDHQELLKTELGKQFPPEAADAAFKLLLGYAPEDAYNKLVSMQLIDWLGDPELAIRELAFYQVYRLTGKTREYQADASPVKLRSSLKSWQEHVKKDGGLLPAQKPTPQPQ